MELWVSSNKKTPYCYDVFLSFAFYLNIDKSEVIALIRNMNHILYRHVQSTFLLNT